MPYFIDCHCHMFTIADVPLYKSIFQLIEDQDKIHKRLLFPFIGLFLSFKDLGGTVQENEKFIRFFEDEANENVSQLATEVQAFANSTGSPFAGRTIVLTPLIMDFDAGGGVNKLDAQIERLTNAITAFNPGNNPVKILPFLGIDPRRNDALAKIDKFDTLRDRTPAGNLPNGSFIGIKLYPPLGFDVSNYMTFYQGLYERRLPITVHCQRDSFRLTSNALQYTDPRKWAKVLEAIPDLLINFAHFGGDDAVLQTVKFHERGENENGYPQIMDGVNEGTFTHEIIRMLKKYPNTYADVSAFDVSSTRAVAALIWLLHLDAAGGFDTFGEHALVDKLLWGSDYPMVLGDTKTNYSTVFSGFAQAIRRTQQNDSYYQYPSGPKIQPALLLQKMVETNPIKFLNL